MAIFYNSTEARSTLSFNTLLIYLSSLRSLLLHGDHGEGPLPPPLSGEEKEYSIAKVLPVYRACMLCPPRSEEVTLPSPLGETEGASLCLCSLGGKNKLSLSVQVKYKHTHQMMFVLFVQNGKSGLS